MVRALIKECHRLKDELVPSKELKKTKDYLIGNLYMGLETTDSLADFYLEQEVTKGNSDTPERVEKDIRAVTAEDVRRVAREIFRKEKLNLAIIGKVKNPSRLKKLLVI